MHQLGNFVRAPTPPPNIRRIECASGTIEHGWWPAQRRDGYMSVSQPSGICLTFSAHGPCEVVTEGKSCRRTVPPGCVSLAGPAPILWCDVEQPSEILEV